MNAKSEMNLNKNDGAAQGASKLEPVRNEKKSPGEAGEVKHFQESVRNPASNSSQTGAGSSPTDIQDRRSEGKAESKSWTGSQKGQSAGHEDFLSNGMEKVESIASNAMEKGSQFIHDVEKSASSRPVLAVAAAAGLGFLVGGIVSKSMRS
jgi:ElaB/YqjD/DUF883 family membrane-anchored ribosome-binding protein